MAQYIYGKLISTGKIIGIGEVPKDISMRKPWACICPECGVNLMARRGDRREDHFAHKPQDMNDGSGVVCSPGAANETALHQMAKEILLDELEAGTAQLVVPAIEFDFREANLNIPYEVLNDIPRRIEYRKQKVLSYTRASVEEWYSGFRPDVIIETNDGEYLIEIYVTHAVQSEKKKMAEEREVPILEIDLSDFTEVSIDKKDLRELIVTKAEHKRWVVRPNNADVLEWGRRYYAGNTRIQQYLAAQAAKEEAHRRRERRFESENYAIELKQLEGQRVSKIQECWFYKYEKSIPFFLSIPIYGEIIFKCDRRVWQGAIFDHFIYNRRSDNDGVYVGKIIQWIKLHQDFFAVDWDLLKGSSLLKDVIKTYLDYLEALGFLSDFTKWNMHYVIEKSHSIVPPNRAYSEQFKAVLASVDRYFVEIDDLLYLKMKPIQDRIDEERREIARQNAEIEEKRRAEEQAQREREAKERAEADRAKKIDRAKQMILAGEYGPELSKLLLDSQGYRLAFCTACNTIKRAYGMKLEPGNLYKGICAKCRTQQNRRTWG